MLSLTLLTVREQVFWGAFVSSLLCVCVCACWCDSHNSQSIKKGKARQDKAKKAMDRPVVGWNLSALMVVTAAAFQLPGITTTSSRQSSQAKSTHLLRLVGHAKNDRIGRMMTMTHFLCFSCSFLERNFPTTMESRMTTPSTTQDRSFRWDTSEMWKDSPFVRGNPHQYKGNNKRVFPNASKRFVERYAKGQTRHPAGCELQLSPPATPTTTTRARASRRVLDRQRV